MTMPPYRWYNGGSGCEGEREVVQWGKYVVVREKGKWYDGGAVMHKRN